MNPVQIDGAWYLYNGHLGKYFNVVAKTWHDDYRDATEFVREENVWDKIAELATSGS